MENKLILKAEKRTEFGKNASGRYRRMGNIPANILERGKSIPVLVEKKDFLKLLSHGLSTSTMIYVDFEGNQIQVLPKEIQRDPVTDEILHVDLYKMTYGHKFHLHIPIELKGVPKGVKSGGALEHYLQMIKVRTIPENLREKIEVNIENLGVGEAIHLIDLNLPKEWDILIQGNPIVCKVAPSRTTIKEAEVVEKEEGKK